MVWGLIREMEHLSYNESLSELELFSLQKGRVQGDLITALQYLRGTYQKKWRGIIAKCMEWQDKGE